MEENLSPAELAVALADVRDELEDLALSRQRQSKRMIAWIGFGFFLLLSAMITGFGPPFLIAFFCLLFISRIGESYRQNFARRRELRERLRLLQLGTLELPPPEP